MEDIYNKYTFITAAGSYVSVQWREDAAPLSSLASTSHFIPSVKFTSASLCYQNSLYDEKDETCRTDQDMKIKSDSNQTELTKTDFIQIKILKTICCKKSLRTFGGFWLNVFTVDLSSIYLYFILLNIPGDPSMLQANKNN